ncbi:Hypothetical Protein RradSPS_0690 [Rubrobacter radiotolerans]|uniref:Polyketide cyclase / dehydrase and lipid transport n=1 Tax=Rubrobacter radiotolerans TaxID=42256 RepID=A0A023X0W4_RUBRA|nr:hypothetical protein [Rubrobacter radiotolerans]AHY45973.1 Hypothetical Protein RradSPS_0690 [Rubrobacter radiotolerans]MDX5893386.1 hypothetical protein [Rubrobacter radiotolerans]SMC03624.1 hypothetical protein SAMN00767673_0689 [Rubrobacter radiotolerans DSM 5868]
MPHVPTGAPAGFVEYVYRKTFTVPFPSGQVWAWLNNPATFTEGQVWPFRVEFVGGGFEPGVLNVHHGPFMLFAGVIGEVREGEYRDLRYFYGSYALSPRFARPTRLQFWTRSVPEGTEVSLRVDSLVRRRFRGLWDAGQDLFWCRFPRWMASALGEG